MAMPPVIELRNISKSFGVTRALANVSISIQEGEVHGLLGRNGAGKSTLVSALSGLVTPDTGEIVIGGDRAWTADEGITDGSLFDRIAMVHQTPALVDSLSVAENLHLEPASISSPSGWVSWKRLNAQSAELLRHWDLDLDPHEPVGELGPAERHLVAIARAMARSAIAVVLDEPTAALPASEIDRLFSRLRTLREQGTTFVYISHHLEEVTRVCDRATILRDGRVIATRDQAALDVQDLVRLVAGKSLAAVERAPASGESVCQQTPLARADAVRAIPSSSGISFDIRPGEIVAVIGLLGSGADQLAECFAGARTPYSGRIELRDGGGPNADRAESVAAGVGYVPADRHAAGFVPAMSVRENASMSALAQVSNRFGILDRGAERDLADSAILAYDIKVSDREQTVDSLSGGNQQKVVLARALATDPSLLVAVHPTRGVDVGAKESIYQLLREFVLTANAVLLVTDELAEVDALATRVIVLRHGDAVKEYTTWTHQDLLFSMEGTQDHA